MARARTIKPGFFVNAELLACEPLARILFAGLWCHADRAGRLIDRPKQFKIEVLPVDDCDVDGLLNQLKTHGFIIRYEVGQARYIQILAFAKHQYPHQKEPVSTIPEPVAPDESPVQARCSPDASPVLDEKVPIQAQPFLSPLSVSPLPISEDSSLRSESARARRLPTDWVPSLDLIAFAEEQKLDPLETADGFRDYWTAQPGARARKLDWDATFRNWCRRQIPLKGQGHGRSGPATQLFEGTAIALAEFERRDAEQEAHRRASDGVVVPLLDGRRG